jgi:hypothetical protein
MYISRDVVFHENRFPFATATPPPEPLDASPALVLPPFISTSPHTQSASSHTIPASPPVSHTYSNVSISDSNTAPSLARIHPMRTRSLNNIVQ